MSVEFWHGVELRNSMDGYLSVTSREEPGLRPHPVLVAETFGNGDASAEFLAARLAACWNAMLGIPDPAATMKEVERFVRAVNFAFTNAGQPGSAIEAGPFADMIRDDARSLLSKLSVGG